MVNEEVTALGSRNGAACKNCHIADDADEKKHRNTHSQRNSSSILMLNFFAASSLHSSQGLKFCQKQIFTQNEQLTPELKVALLRPMHMRWRHTVYFQIPIARILS